MLLPLQSVSFQVPEDGVIKKRQDGPHNLL